VDASLSIECDFDEDTEISEAFASLTAQLVEFLNTVKLYTLQLVLCQEVRANQLGDSLVKEIKSAKTVYDLLDTLSENLCSNWINLKFFKMLARCTKYKSTARKLIQEYEKFLHCKKLVAALQEQFPKEKQEIINDYISEVAVKINTDIGSITVGDLLDNRTKLRDVILELGSGILNIKHVTEGCLDMRLFMSAHLSFIAYKMALQNRHKFWILNMVWIKLEKFPVICSPLLYDLEQTYNDKCRGK